ncbi:hypothetical protein B1C81_27140 [Streptomyces sp. HG99]|nr:hypothetical protein B1C81_27140 [Streptomyces sp. HG99]
MRLRLPEERPTEPPTGYKIAHRALSQDGTRAVRGLRRRAAPGAGRRDRRGRARNRADGARPVRAVSEPRAGRRRLTDPRPDRGRRDRLRVGGRRAPARLGRPGPGHPRRRPGRSARAHLRPTST